MQTENILLQDWQTPFKMPPFEAIRDEHFLPAFDESMRLHLAEIAQIAENPADPTFANTIEALERAGQALRNTASVFFNLASADANEERQSIERTISPKLSGHRMAILTNPKLFARIAKLCEAAGVLGLDAEQAQLLENYHKKFVRAGAKLDAPSKARLAEIETRLSGCIPRSRRMCWRTRNRFSSCLRTRTI